MTAPAIQWDPMWVHAYCSATTTHDFRQTHRCDRNDAECIHCGKFVAVARAHASGYRDDAA